jgi:hypothetical protein
MILTGIKTDIWTTTQEFTLGQIGFTLDTHGSKEWRYVKLRNETATVAVAGTSSAAGLPLTGAMLAYLAAPANAAEVNTVVSDFTDAETIPVGAGMAFAAVAGVASTAYYGWVQRTGYAESVTAIGGTADNDLLICASTDMTLTVATAVTDPFCAICIGDTAQTVRLRCP